MDKSLTFMVDESLGLILFSTKSDDETSGGYVSWVDTDVPNIRLACQEYYNLFPGKEYIQELRKYINNGLSYVSTKDYIWVPSTYELGGTFTTSYATAPPTEAPLPPDSESTNGTTDPYPYFTSNISRIKAVYCTSYWTRSLNPRYSVDSPGNKYIDSYTGIIKDNRGGSPTQDRGFVPAFCFS